MASPFIQRFQALTITATLSALDAATFATISMILLRTGTKSSAVLIDAQNSSALSQLSSAAFASVGNSLEKYSLGFEVLVPIR